LTEVPLVPLEALAVAGVPVLDYMHLLDLFYLLWITGKMQILLEYFANAKIEVG
jgi:hypothetical protein